MKIGVRNLTDLSSTVRSKTYGYIG